MSIKASANVQQRISLHFDLFKIELFQLDLYIHILFPSRRVFMPLVGHSEAKLSQVMVLINVTNIVNNILEISCDIICSENILLIS